MYYLEIGRGFVHDSLIECFSIVVCWISHKLLLRKACGAWS